MLKNRKTIDVKTENNKVIIKFPIGIGGLICYILLFVGLVVVAVVLHTYYKELIDRVGNVLLIAIYIFVALGLIMNIIRFFVRKVIIDKENKSITYVSLYKKSFDVQQITKMECKKSYGETDYFYLVIWLNNKKIKIRTESEEQSQALKDVINSLTAQND